MTYKHLLFQNKKGQALVESAIIFPILIFFMIGVFEVGWVLRSYLVLQNAAREGARFSIRSDYLDYSLPNPGYEKVVTHTLASIGETLPLDFQETGDLYISRISVSTPVLSLTNFIPGTEPYDCTICEDTGNFFEDCKGVQGFRLAHKSCVFTETTLLHSGIISNYAAVFPVSSTFQSQINITETSSKLIEANKLNNCQLTCKGGVGRVNNIMIVELYYEQPQLFGFPLISNPLTDPISIYTYAIFRDIVAERNFNE